MVLKETMENYVKAIYSLSRWGEVRPYQLADYLSVSRPTVSTTVGHLSKRDLSAWTIGKKST